MGLSSSQARLLTLTAKKSDLELRAQIISQRKINLAMQTESLALEYANATSKTRLTLKVGAKENEDTVDLSYNRLMNPSEDNKDTYGVYLVRSALTETYLYSDDKNKIDVLQKLEMADTGKNTLSEDDLIKNYGSQVSLNKNLTDNSYFQEALKNGAMYLCQKVSQDGKAVTAEEKQEKGTFTTVSLSGTNIISEERDKSEEIVAQARYESKTVMLSNQDRMLDLELNQIETQHQACETEVESVQKLIDNNIKATFKIFS